MQHKHNKYLISFLLIALVTMHLSCERQSKEVDTSQLSPTKIYEYSNIGEPRWVSFENSSGGKGEGAKENHGAKGHPYDRINAGDTITLLDFQGAGMINRMWITIRDRSPKMLRSLVLNMYWDNEEKPAVSVPFGDFFSVGLGRTATFQNVFFANPEGRSFNCFIPMPFKKGAKIEITNHSDIDLTMIFYDVNLQSFTSWSDNYMYFHSFWHRDTATTVGKDFELLPEIQGKGRFLGVNVGVITNPVYKDHWWGEGEVKIYLNGDGDYPTLVGTGTEDYIGTAWGQGQYINEFTGSSIADPENRLWSFYRFHVPDPVYFQEDIRVTLQQMGGSMKTEVLQLIKEGIDLTPVTIQDDEKMVHIYNPSGEVDLENPELIDGWTNYYRSDDVSATAYFYYENPSSELPDIQSVMIRVWNLKESE